MWYAPLVVDLYCRLVRRHLHAWASVLVLTAGALFLISGCSTTPADVELSPAAAGTALQVATLVTDRVGESLVRADALLDIGDGFRELDNLIDAVRVAEESIRILDTLPDSEDSAGLRLRAAELLLAADRPEPARRLIRDVTAFANSVRDEDVRTRLLPDVIEVAATGADFTRDLLPAAVDPVYIIEDTAVRARTFMSIIDVYQALGVGQSVFGLFQQCIPAIRSVADPMLRARLFAELAIRALDAGYADLGEDLAENASAEFNLAGVSAVPDARAASAVIAAVTRADGATDALADAGRIETAEVRAEALLTIGAGAGVSSAALLAVGRAVGAAAEVEDPVRSALLLSRAARAYLELGRQELALQTAALATSELTVVRRTADLVDILQPLLEVYALLDRTDELDELLQLVTDAYGRAIVRLHVAELLITEGRQGTAEDYLVGAFLDADEAGSFADPLRVQVVDGFARTRNYALAIRAIERIDDRAIQARATARFARYADPQGGLTDDQLDDLRAVLDL